MQAFKIKIKDRDKLNFTPIEIEEDKQPVFRAIVTAKVTLVCDDEKSAERLVEMKKEDRDKLIKRFAGDSIQPADLSVMQFYRLKKRG